MKKILGGIALGLGGVAFHMYALWLAEKLVDDFPSVTDIFMRELPVLDLFGIGEVGFVLLLAGFGFVLLRQRAGDIGYVFALLGIFYAARGVFLLFMPIGAPADAPGVADRFVLYPYPAHAFFPGGHVGIMFIMSLLIQNLRVRMVFIGAVLLFGAGSIFTRAHYTADIFGGLLLGYAVWAFGEAHLKRHFQMKLLGFPPAVSHDPSAAERNLPKQKK